MTYYEIVEELCSRKGITIHALEKDLGFARATIAKWDGTSEPAFKRIAAVADYFEIPVDVFKDGEGLMRDEIMDSQFVDALIKLTKAEVITWMSYGENTFTCDYGEGSVTVENIYGVVMITVSVGEMGVNPIAKPELARKLWRVVVNQSDMDTGKFMEQIINHAMGVEVK